MAIWRHAMGSRLVNVTTASRTLSFFCVGTVVNSFLPVFTYLKFTLLGANSRGGGIKGLIDASRLNVLMCCRSSTNARGSTLLTKN